jgi:hypothetical protein
LRRRPFGKSAARGASKICFNNKMASEMPQKPYREPKENDFDPNSS